MANINMLKQTQPVKVAIARCSNYLKSIPSRIWAWFCYRQCIGSRFLEQPKNALVFFRAYLLLIFVFALCYSILDYGFKISGDIRALSTTESIYFSVVTITTLGYGDIIPVSTAAQILISLQALLGITVIGVFLVWVGHDQAQKEQEKYLIREQARRDRPRFPTYVKLVSILSNYLRSFDMEYGRPLNSFGWNVYEFGNMEIGVAATLFYPERYYHFLSGMTEVDAQSTMHWSDDIVELQKTLDSTIKESEHPIDEIEMLSEFKMFYRMCSEKQQHLRYQAPGGKSLDEFIGQRALEIEPLVRRADALRSRICKKSERGWSGVDHRYASYYRKYEDSPLGNFPSKFERLGSSLGVKYLAIKKRFRDE